MMSGLDVHDPTPDAECVKAVTGYGEDIVVVNHIGGQPMAKLDGKVAIVTGAARGLGRAYSKRLAGLGAKVAVADLNLHSYEEFEAEARDMAAESTVAEIEAAGGTALGIELDVRDREAVDGGAGRPGMGAGRCARRECGWRSRSTRRYEGQHPRSGALAASHRDEPVRDDLLLQRRRPNHEAAAVGGRS